MADRRTRILDAALDLVGSQGLRALTHRGVDAAAGLPVGSVSNVFRTRADLVGALLDHLLERELALWDVLSASAGAPQETREQAVGSAARLLAESVRLMCGPARGLCLAQQALFHEAAFDPGLQRRVLAARGQVTEHGKRWFAGRGLPLDTYGLTVLLATMTGIMAEQNAGPDPDFDPEAGLRRVLEAVAGDAG